MFFVSVASKGLRVCVSGLESTLAGVFTSVDSKRLNEMLDKMPYRRDKTLTAGRMLRRFTYFLVYQDVKESQGKIAVSNRSQIFQERVWEFGAEMPESSGLGRVTEAWRGRK